jgi:hypothetical protein
MGPSAESEREREGEKQLFVRFVLCELGSEDVEDEGEQEEEGEACGGGGFRRFAECNDNGIVRFPMHVCVLLLCRDVGRVGQYTAAASASSF